MLIAFFVVPAACSGFGSFGEVADEVAVADGFVGVGLRAAGMGWAHIALAQDFSAAYYNPAGLAYVYKRELAGAIGVRSGRVETSLNGCPDNVEFSAVKLQLLGGVYPLAARRGGAAFAIGYSRSQSFDRSANFSGQRADGASITAVETDDGGLGALHIAFGVQTSKSVAFGASLEFITGAENYTWDAMVFQLGDTVVADTVFSDNITHGYSGITGRVGLLIAPSRYFAWGAVVKFPSALTTQREAIYETTVDYLDGTQEYEYDSYKYDIDMTTPFQFGSGIAIKSPFVNVAADVVYTDWRQMRYRSSDWVEQNPWIPSSYRAVLAWGVGAEFTIPIRVLPMRLRGGYRYDPVSYAVTTIEKERQILTGGLSLLVDKRWLVEGAVAFSNWQRTDVTQAGNSLGEKYRLYDVQFGISYRF